MQTSRLIPEDVNQKSSVDLNSTTPTSINKPIQIQIVNQVIKSGRFSESQYFNRIRACPHRQRGSRSDRDIINKLESKKSLFTEQTNVDQQINLNQQTFQHSMPLVTKIFQLPREAMLFRQTKKNKQSSPFVLDPQKISFHEKATSPIDSRTFQEISHFCKNFDLNVDVRKSSQSRLLKLQKIDFSSGSNQLEKLRKRSAKSQSNTYRNREQQQQVPLVDRFNYTTRQTPLVSTSRFHFAFAKYQTPIINQTKQTPLKKRNTLVPQQVKNDQNRCKSCEKPKSKSRVALITLRMKNFKNAQVAV